MSLRHKILFLGIGLLPLALGLVYFRSVDQLERNQSEILLEQQSQQVALGKRIVEMQVQLLQSELAREAIESGKVPLKVDSPFAAVVTLSRDTNGQWMMSDLRKNVVNNEAQGWPTDFESQVFKTVQPGDLQAGLTHWQRGSDPAGHPLFVVGQIFQFPNESSTQDANTSQDKIVLGILKSSPLYRQFDELKTSKSSIFVLDKKGFVAASSLENEVGELLIEKPVAQNALKQTALVGHFETQESGERYLVGFSKVAGSDLLLVSSTPHSVLASSLNPFKKVFIAVGVGGLLIWLALSFLITSSLTSRLKQLKAYVTHLLQGEYHLKPLEKSKDELGEVSQAITQLKDVLVSEKAQSQTAAQGEAQAQKVYQDMSSGVGITIRNPILSILGQIQIAKKKNRDDRIIEPLSAIEEESRKIKDVVDRLLKFSGSEKFSVSDMAIRDVVQKSVDMRKEKWTHLGINFEVDLQDVPKVRANEFQFLKALDHIYANAEEALREVTLKQIQIQLTQTEYVIRLMIKDSGVGMSNDVRRRAFDPFFTQKEQHTGLGLSYTLGVLKDAGGDVQIHSQVGVGTQVFLDIPLETTQAEVDEVQTSVATKNELASQKVSEKSLEALAAFEFLLGDGPADFNFSSIDSVQSLDLASASQVHQWNGDHQPKWSGGALDFTQDSAQEFGAPESEPAPYISEKKVIQRAPVRKPNSRPRGLGSGSIFGNTILGHKPANRRPPTETSHQNTEQLSEAQQNEEWAKPDRFDIFSGSVSDQDIAELNELKEMTKQIESGRLTPSSSRLRRPKLKNEEGPSSHE